MKKIVTLTIVAVFVYAVIRYVDLTGNKDSEKIIAEAFNQTNLESVETTITFEDEYNGEYLSRENAKKVLSTLAKEIGVVNNYQIEEEKREGFGNVSLVKDGKNAKTHLEIITYENSGSDNEIWTKQYLKVEIIVYDNVEQALIWKEKLDSILKKYIQNPSGKIGISGEYAGELTVNKKNVITDKLMSDTKTKEIISHRSENMYIIYGLSDIIDTYREIDGAKINMSISIDYDENREKTMLTLASPI